MSGLNAKQVWERPTIVRMDAADAKNGVNHHQDGKHFRRKTSLLS